MEAILVGAVFLVLLVSVAAIGFALGAVAVLPKCTRCSAPQPDGFMSWDSAGCYCSKCTKETGRKPWYWKPVMNGK